MKTKIIYLVTSIFLFLITIPAMAQRDPGDEDIDAVPIDDYIWVLLLVGVVYAILKLKMYAQLKNQF